MVQSSMYVKTATPLEHKMGTYSDITYTVINSLLLYTEAVNVNHQYIQKTTLFNNIAILFNV
jgi:hypothetical protein